VFGTPCGAPCTSRPRCWPLPVLGSAQTAQRRNCGHPHYLSPSSSSKAVSTGINKPAQSQGDTHLVTICSAPPRILLPCCAPSSHLKHGQGNLRSRIVNPSEDHDAAYFKTFMASPFGRTTSTHNFIAKHVAGFVCRHRSYMLLKNTPTILPSLQ
jgi:hypothetical protein